MTTSKERKVRTVVVGLGPIGNLHARIYRSDSIAELVGVCDIDEARAAEGGRTHQVPSYVGLETMLTDLKPEVVSVATGGYEYCSDHYEPTMISLQHGCHVLCEKPICNDLAKASQMVRFARERGLCFGLDFNHRFTPAAYAAKKWVESGELGSLIFCNMALWIGKFGSFDSRNFHLKALNPHSVNLMSWLCGPISKVQCFATVAPGRDIWSTASFNFLFENGCVGHLTSSYDIARAHSVERCEVAGVDGRLTIEEMWQRATLFPAASQERKVYENPVFGGFANFDDTFRERLGQFIRQIAAGAKPDEIDGSGADGLACQTVIHAAIKSIDENWRVVDVSEVAV